MAESPLTFGTCLDQWMTTHGLSGAALAAMTGAKSATSISRLRHNKCTPKRCEAFLAALLSASPAVVSAEEERRFRTALEVSRLASNAVSQDEEFRQLFFPQETVLPAFLPEQAKALSMSMTEGSLLCFYPVSATFFHAIQAVLNQLGNRIRIRCFLPAPWPEQALHFAVDALPVLCDPRCTIAMLPPKATCLGHLAVLRYRREDGCWCEELMVLSAKRIHTLPLPDGCGMYDFFLSLTSAAEAINPPQPLSTPESFLAFMERCYAREQGAEICLLHAGPCMELFPVEILQNALMGAEEIPGYEQLALDIRRVAYLRFINHFEKKKPTHLLLSRRALVHFMQTGRLEDHLAFLRPLTLEERTAVLRHLKHQAETNPAFDLRIARDERLFGAHTFVSCGGAGVYVCPSATDYVHTAGAPYCEAFLPDPAFAKAFRDYFCRVLLPEHALSREDSVRVLAEVLEGG